MANFLEKVNYSVMSMPKAMNRTNPAPLDASAVWTSLEDLRNYAQTSAVAYVGQILSLVEYNAETEEISTVKAYIIKDAAGNIEEVGSATLGDDASIELVNGVLSVKDFGKRYYKYIAAVEGGKAAHYELTEGWIAGLEPRVAEEDGKMVIGWYEPNPTTAEGVKDQVVAVQGEVEQAKKDIDAAEQAIETLEGSVAEAEEAIEGINNALYGTGEGEEAVAGLVERVETLEGEMDAVQPDVATLKTDVAGLKTSVANVYTKTETYTKGEVNDLVSNAVSGVFHFRGAVDTFENLPAEKAEGDVYQVGEKEYAWNGTEWVELGFLVDLTDYATKVYAEEKANAAAAVVAGDLDKAEENIAKNAEDIGKNAQAITALQNADTAIGERIDGVEDDVSALVEEDERLAGLIDGHGDRIEVLETAKGDHAGRIEALETAKSGFDTHFQTVDGKIEALETAKTGFDTQFETVNGKITALEKADEGFETRIGTLEGYVGTPTGNLGALYPAVESLNQRLNDIVAEGGEPNQLNGISISGTLVPVNDSLIAELPIFIGSAAGLVPIATEGLTDHHMLNAKGNWVNPFGDLGEKTVKEYVDQKVEEIVVEWSAI